MILPFKTKFPDGTPTYFINKIWLSRLLTDSSEAIDEWFKFNELYKERFGTYFYKSDSMEQFQPKKTTIREDKSDRWKPGVIIDFFINSRTKDMFRFAPRIPIVSTQKIDIFWNTPFKCDFNSSSTIQTDNGYVVVYVDDRPIGRTILNKIAINDGFDSLDDFLGFFNKAFRGKILHWTDLKY